MPSLQSSGCLYVVATPIGNLEDLTIRAARILGEVDLIAAEDTRVSRKLLNHIGIATPLVSHYKGQEARQSAGLVKKLLQGQTIALISDAGTPAISDPGSRLVHDCHEANIKVIPIPGPSALTSLTSVAGLPEGGFIFLGFLPSKKGQRRKLLTRYSQEELPLIFYESPHRIIASLKDVESILGNRPACLGRELTKLHEEILAMPVGEARAFLQNRATIKGEFVVAIHGCETEEISSEEDVEQLLIMLHAQGNLSMKDAVKKLSRDLGLSRSEVYKIGLQVWKKDE